MIWANNLRFFAVFAVIILHVSATFVSGIEQGSDLYGGYDWWVGNVFDSSVRWCVPVFVMISGYFLLSKSESSRVFFDKRASKILVPLIFWIALFSLWIIFKGAMKGDVSSSMALLLNNFKIGEPYYHLWYLIMILFLYTITPALRLVIEKINKSEMQFLLAFLFIMSAINVAHDKLFFNGADSDEIFINKFLLFIPYYVLGGYIKRFDIHMSTCFSFILFISSVTITIVGAYYYTDKYFYNYLSVNTIIASISIFFIIKNCADFDIKSEHFANLSFGIYLIHPIFIELVSQALRVKVYSLFGSVGYIAITSVLVFALSYLSVLVMSKSKVLKKCI
ncbi:acyltransferase family protein [Providencia sp.]|uniref:acyltransferase n=1 Tax=Providencia sp. TaxID=589 RepID=UPI0033405E9F